MSICRKCGQLLPPGAAVCPYCGTSALPQAENAPQQPGAAGTYPPPEGTIPQPGAQGVYPPPFGAAQKNAYPYPPAPNPFAMPPQPGAAPPYGAAPQPPQRAGAAYLPVCPAEPDGGLSTAQYFWMLILFMLPIVGLILMFYWGFAGGVAPARQRLARAFLIKAAVVAGLSLLLLSLWGALAYSLFHSLLQSSAAPSLGRYTAAACAGLFPFGRF